MRQRTKSIRISKRWWLLTLSLAAALVPVDPGWTQVSEKEQSLRQNVAWQVRLDDIGLSPGLIDGRVGPKTRLATRAFQRVRKLPITGELDSATAQALGIDPDHVFGRYAIETKDLAEIGPAPKSWLARSKLKRLGHETLTDVLAEKFHCTRHLLATLNPRTNLNRLQAGDKVVVPIVSERESWPQAAYIEVNLAEKVIRVIDHHQRLAALFHCSIAASKSNLPKHNGRVTKIAKDPTYTFDPKMWSDVKEKITRKLDIPPGPRNPVGRFWIGLSLPGYGIHGTPNSELIGKTGSHGCIRLTNWDAIQLGKMVRIGTEVRFVDKPEGQ